MRCFECGRLLKRAAFTVPAMQGVHEGGALGPKCAQRRGFITPKKAPLFAAKRRRVREVQTTDQMALELA